MAPMQIKCPGCAATLRLSKPPTPGKKLRCPKCNSVFSPTPPQGILEQSAPPAVPKGSFRREAPIPAVQPEVQPADFDFDVEPVVPRTRKRPEGGQVPSTASTIASSSDDRTMGMLCYLLGIFTSFIGPLIIWLMKKDQSRFVDYHGREVLNFIINLIIAWLMVVAVVMALSFVTFGIGAILILPLYLSMIVYSLVVSIMGAMKANRGELYHIPMTIRIIPLPAGVASGHVARPAIDEESREVIAEDSGPQPSPWPKILLIGGGVAGLLTLMFCGGCGYWIYQAKRSVDKTIEKEFQANFPKQEFDFPKGMDPGVNQPPGFIPPPAINEPLKVLRPPANLDEALAAIKSGDSARQLLAVNWLARANVDAARQPEIAKALERLLTDPDKNLQNAAMKALVVWASTDNVPAIITVVQNEEFSPQVIEARHLGMATLGRLKDERGVAPVAQRLSNIHDRSFASKALIAMGPIAETEVAKNLENNDIGTQREACRILKAIGTKASIPALEVASRSKNRQVAAAAKDALNTVKARGG
jgi:uncharacterized protein